MNLIQELLTTKPTWMNLQFLIFKKYGIITAHKHLKEFLEMKVVMALKMESLLT